MSIKDKVIFGLLSIILIAGVYFQVMANDMKSRMSELSNNDSDHLDIIDKEFREGLRQFDLKFEGRGKHIRKAQEDIISNANLIEEKASQLSDKIEEVQYNLDEFTRVTNKKIERTNNDVTDLQDSFDSQRRLTSRKLSDLEQSLTQLKNEVKDLQDPDKDKKK